MQTWEWFRLVSAKSRSKPLLIFFSRDQPRAETQNEEIVYGIICLVFISDVNFYFVQTLCQVFLGK